MYKLILPAVLLLPCLFSPLLSAAEQQNVADSEDRPNQPLDEYEADQGRKKPFDLGLGLGLGSGQGLSLFGSDFILGKRLVNNRDWGFGVQYHRAGYISEVFSEVEMNAIYATAALHDIPLEFKLGFSRLSRVDDLGNQNHEYGPAVGIGLFSASNWLDGNLRVHLLDYHYVTTASGTHSVWSVSVLILAALR